MNPKYRLLVAVHNFPQAPIKEQHQLLLEQGFKMVEMREQIDHSEPAWGGKLPRKFVTLFSFTFEEERHRFSLDAFQAHIESLLKIAKIEFRMTHVSHPAWLVSEFNDRCPLVDLQESLKSRGALKDGAQLTQEEESLQSRLIQELIDLGLKTGGAK